MLLVVIYIYIYIEYNRIARKSTHRFGGLHYVYGLVNHRCKVSWTAQFNCWRYAVVCLQNIFKAMTVAL